MWYKYLKTKKVTHQLMLYTSSLPTLSWYDICMYVQTSNYIIFPLVCHMDNTVIRDIATLIVWVIIIIQGVCQKKKGRKNFAWRGGMLWCFAWVLLGVGRIDTCLNQFSSHALLTFLLTIIKRLSIIHFVATKWQGL